MTSRVYLKVLTIVFNKVYLKDDFEGLIERCRLYDVTLTKPDDFFKLKLKFYNRLNESKPTMEQYNDIVTRGKKLIFDIPWIRQLGESLESYSQEL